MSLNLIDFSKEVFENAKAHGWHDNDRSIPEILALIHSELSEALEEYRCARGNVWYGENKKPEGIAIELIDAVIRVLDFLGKYEARFKTNTVRKLIDVIQLSPGKKLHDQPLPDIICELHFTVSKAYESKNVSECFSSLLDMCAIVFKWLEEEGLDPEALLIEKHEFNKSRPYRHGNKVC